MTDRDHEALSDILRVLDRALGFPIADFEAFVETDYLQDALIRCLEVLGEAVKRLSPELRELNQDLPWRGMAGLRDLLFMPTTVLTWRRSGRPMCCCRASGIELHSF